MDDSNRQLQTLVELDIRHDELLEKLHELDHRVTEALSEWTAGRDSTEHAREADATDCARSSGPNGGLSAVQPPRFVDSPPEPQP